MPLLLEQTSDRGEWAVPCLQTGIFTLLQIRGEYFLRNTHPCDDPLYFQACFTLTQPFAGQAYSENPADFKPLTTEEMARIKAEKRQKDQVPQISLEDIYLKLVFN